MATRFPKRRKIADAAGTKSGDIIAILDAGSQYGKVIDRRIRQLNVEAHILPLNTASETLRSYKAVIISGGPHNLDAGEDEEQPPEFNSEVFSLGIPVLGICYGFQLIAHHLGGKLSSHDHLREDGQYNINLEDKSALFEGIASPTEVLLTHGVNIEDAPPSFKVIARSENGIISAIENKEKCLYGVQFHPEVDLTVRGMDIFRNFLFGVCKCAGNFTMNNRESEAIAAIRKQVGDNNVLCLLSGGVDSSVCAALLKAALGEDKIFAVHVDNGFMRLDESKKVVEALRSIGLKNLSVAHASQDFYSATTSIDGKKTERLDETVQPEVKRKIIGDTFIRVSENKIKELNLNPDTCFLAQGTLRPDLIESASSHASTNASVIKTHHNDTQLVRALRDAGRVVEPLADYHKDEVRHLGESLGLAPDLVWRQPFPGPGLAIRILCTEKPFKSSQEDTIVGKLKELSTKSVTATLLPCRTVGVQGDSRTYSSLVGLSCNGDPDWSSLMTLAKEIPKVLRTVNRVIYVFGPRIEQGQLKTITPSHLQPSEIRKLQLADEIVNQALARFKLLKILAQVPVILFPVNFGEEEKHAIAIRAFISNDFMTGQAAVPGVDIPIEFFSEVVKEILSKVPGVSRVCYDLTSKPPATTEWE